MNNESITKTFTVATVLCVVCAIIVSISDVSLKGLQKQNKALDKQTNILVAAGLVAPGEKIASDRANELFQSAETVVVDLTTGEIATEVDATTVESNPGEQIVLDAEADIAGIKSTDQYAVVYLFKNESGDLKTAVLPIVGTGLWSTLYGFISLNADLTTVANIVFYDHGETPGLGGEISNPKWTAKWRDKVAFDAEGAPAIKVVKGSAQNEYEVDGISGATLTGKGVTNTVQFWLGENGYGPFLKNLRAKSASATSADASAN